MSLQTAPPPEVVAGRKRRRLLSLCVSMVFFAAVAVYIARSLSSGIAQVDWKRVHFDIFDLAASLGFALLTNLLAAESNHNLITTIAPDLPRRRIYSAILITRLGRYIPGKLATIAGAGLLLREHGVSALATTSLVTINTLLTNGMGLIIGLPLLLGPLFGHRASPATLALGAAALLAGILMLHPRVGLPLLAALIRRLTGRTIDLRLPNRALVASALCITLNWVAAGLSLWLVVRGFGGQAGGFRLLQCTSAAAVAVTLGFLTLFAPGGLGVREWVFLSFLTPLFGPGPAAVMTICMRLIHVAADVICAVAGSLLGRLAKTAR